MNVVDSAGWLEYFADEPKADFFAGAIENPCVETNARWQGHVGGQRSSAISRLICRVSSTISSREL